MSIQLGCDDVKPDEIFTGNIRISSCKHFILEGTVNGTVTVEPGSHLLVLGTVNGHVVNKGNANIKGRINGTFANYGSAQIEGRVTRLLGLPCYLHPHAVVVETVQDM